MNIKDFKWKKRRVKKKYGNKNNIKDFILYSSLGFGYTYILLDIAEKFLK